MLDLLQQEVGKRQALEAQMQKLTETLNSYVHGYAELRKKLNEMNEKLENVTTTLSTTNAEYGNVIQKYNDLERSCNDTQLTVVKQNVRLVSMESNFNTNRHRSESFIRNCAKLDVTFCGSTWIVSERDWRNYVKYNSTRFTVIFYRTFPRIIWLVP